VAKRRGGGIAETNVPVLYYGEIYNRVVRRSGGTLGGVAKANRRKNSENEEDHENGQLREWVKGAVLKVIPGVPHGM
jgi:hypothetical protein